MMFTGFIILTIYLFLLLFLWIGNLKLKPVILLEKKPRTAFSIVVPFRNEAENLTGLVRSIKQLDYPTELLEVIFVDDASEDNSVLILSKSLENCVFSFKIVRNEQFSNSPKKDAITKAVSEAKHEWIITTDADCTLPKKWLQSFDIMVQKKNPSMICGPVTYKSNGSHLEAFQQFDGLSLQAVTMGGFGHKQEILCNGANLGYKKEVFKQVEGFTGNNHIASGDDVFMIEKIKETHPGSIFFLKTKNAVVTTQPKQNWNQVSNQRVRWASKTKKQKNGLTKAIGAIVFLVNLWIVFSWIHIFYHPQFLSFYIFVFLIKISVDGFIVFSTGSFFKTNFFTKKLIIPFLVSSVMYPFITVYVFIMSLLGNYQWKGRHFKT